MGYSGEMGGILAVIVEVRPDTFIFCIVMKYYNFK